MLKKKEQEKFIRKRGSNIVRYITDFSRQQDPESLHQLRVEVKKLKGFLALTGHCTHSQKLSNAARQIFKQGGMIRTAHLNLEFIRQYKLRDKGFKQEQDSVIASQTDEFTRHANDYNKTIRKTARDISKGLKPIHDKCIIAWFKKLTRDLEQVFKRPDNAKLHEGRKTIKNLLHVHTMLDKKMINNLQLNVEYLEQLQEAVGKWHDVVVSYEMLSMTKSKNKKIMETFEKEISNTLTAVRKLAASFATKIKAKTV